MMIDFDALAIVPARDEDYEFSFQVKKLAQGPWIIRLWGWDEERQRMFHRKDWDEKRPSVITYAGNPIGTIRVARDDDGFDIQQFFLLPEYHNSGIGSHLMRRVLREADEAGEPVRLAILLGSRVKSFYERLGFRVLRQDESFCFMKRPAQQQGA